MSDNRGGAFSAFQMSRGTDWPLLCRNSAILTRIMTPMKTITCVCHKSLQPDQTLLVTRLDRLARSTVDLLTIIKTIADKGCLFKSLADPWADTTTPAGRLMLTVLGGLAEFERSLILARTSEGRDRAIRAGIRMGRKPKLSSHQMAEVRDRKTAGESTRTLARSYGVSPNTISRVR